MADLEKELAAANKKIEKLEKLNSQLAKEKGELELSLKSADDASKSIVSTIDGLTKENSELKKELEEQAELLKSMAEENKAVDFGKDSGMKVFSVNKKKYGIPLNLGVITVPGNVKEGFETAKFNVKDIESYPKHAAWLVENSPVVTKF